MKTIDLQVGKRAALACVVVLIVACSWLLPMESVADQHIENGLKRALLSFASARALNAVISVAQGTQVAAEPGGVGLVFAPGQLLDPFNDLVEQFGHLMLAASVALGIERILVGLGAHWSIKILLSATAVVWGYFYVFKQSPRPWINRTLAVLVMARFAMPVVMIGSDMAFQEIMATDYRASQQFLDSTLGRLETVTPPVAAAPQTPGWMPNIPNLLKNLDPTDRLAKFKNAAEQAVEGMIKLMVIFLLQTMIIPLFMLWVLWSVVKRIFERPQIPRLAVTPAQV